MRVQLTVGKEGEIVYELHHRETYNCITLDKVFQEISEFFADYPNETVVMRIKKEEESDPLITDSFETAIQRLFENFQGLVYT